MKNSLNKIFFILLLSVINLSVARATEPITLDELENNTYFKSPYSAPDPELRNTSTPINTGGFDNMDIYSYDQSMDDDIDPLFKQVRVHLTNKFRKKQYEEDVKEYNKLIREEQEENTEKEKVSFKNRLKILKKDKPQTSQDTNETPHDLVADSIKSKVNPELNVNDTLSLSAGITEDVTEKEMILDAPYVSVDEESGDMIATGRPTLYFPPQNTTVVADKFTHNYYSSIITGEGNVIITKDGSPSHADFVEIDRNEETIDADNFMTMNPRAILKAKHAQDKDSIITLTDGNLYSEESFVYRFSTYMLGPNLENMIIDPEERSYMFNDENLHKLNLVADEVIAVGHKNYTKYTAKNIQIYFKDKKILSWPSMTAYANKYNKNFEANYPEFGNKSKLGMFIGPGITFPGPFGSIMKVVPFLNYNKNFGFGGALKYRTVYNNTELGYGSSQNIFYLRGQQRLDDHLYLQYGVNSYLDEWFIGARMPRYGVEAFYDKTHILPDFLAKNLPLTFRHRAGFGLMQDNPDDSNSLTTVRGRYMAGISQSLYNYRNKEHKFYFDVSAVMEGTAAVYGTGNTQIIGRIGPRVHVQYKHWMQDIGYYQSAFDDNTPMPSYDSFRYGNSALSVAEVIRLHKWLTIGWAGLFNLSNDSPNGNLLQENRFIIAIGPDDFRVRFGYDFERETTYVGFDVAFDTKKTNLKYGKMVIKNPEMLNKKIKEKEELISYVSPAEEAAQKKLYPAWFKPKAKTTVLKYATVIEIEDPDKEKIE